MEIKNLAKLLSDNSYPGRGIVLGKSPNGKYAVIAYLSWAEVKTAETGSLRKTTAAAYAPRRLMNLK